MNPIGKSISATFLSNIWLALLLLVLTPVYVRLLGIESYGLIGFYASWVAILGILDMGISATATREIAWLSARPEEERKIPTLLRSLELFYGGIIVLVGLGFMGGGWFFGPEWFNTATLTSWLLRQTLFLMSVSLIVQVPSGLYAAGLIGMQRQAECAGLLALFGTVRSVGAIVVLLLIGPDIRLFFLWQVVASTFQVVLIRRALWRKFIRSDGPARFSWEALHAVRKFAGGMTLITALSLVLCQADKILLSRFVPLKSLGFYTLAWAVASGLMLAAMPLMQAYGPRYTNLISSGNQMALAEQVRKASQLMNAMILPPAAFIIALTHPILFIWLGDSLVAAGAAPVLQILVVGTALIACSYPALNILYSENQLRPVITINLACFVILLPILILAILNLGILGAAYCWALYGIILFVSYQYCGLRRLPGTGLFGATLKNFMGICLASWAIASIGAYWLRDIQGKFIFVTLLFLGLSVGWLASIALCEDLRKVLKERGSLFIMSR